MEKIDYYGFNFNGKGEKKRKTTDVSYSFQKNEDSCTFEDSSSNSVDCSFNSSLLGDTSDIFSDVSDNKYESDRSKYIEIYHPVRCCWTLCEELWSTVYEKDSLLAETRQSSVLAQHPGLAPVHRAILLDWIMEVCDLYAVSRDTYHHALDFFDRYLSSVTGIQRGALQLIGVTCLLMASKMEEVKTIPLVDLVFLADGLLQEEEVLDMEKKIFEAIDWKCYVWTANKWLFVYLHVLKRRLPSKQFCQMTQLLDLATLDIGSLQFSYSVLAASSIFLVTSFSGQLPVRTNTIYLNICECTSWMEKYWDIIKKKNYSHREIEIDTSHVCNLFSNSIAQVYDDILNLYNSVNIKEEYEFQGD